MTHHLPQAFGWLRSLRVTLEGGASTTGLSEYQKCFKTLCVGTNEVVKATDSQFGRFKTCRFWNTRFGVSFGFKFHFKIEVWSR